jgi:hypothetical protein
MNLFTNFGIRASGSEILLLAPTITFVSKTANSITFTLRNNGPITANIFYQQGVNPPTANFISLNSGQTSSNTTISGLNPSTSYTIFARAQATSAISSSVVSITETTNAATGQQLFTSSGTWVAPAGVTSVSVVCVGGGGQGGRISNGSSSNVQGASGGGGGGLGWKNNISVTPGQSYTVTVGAGGFQTQYVDGGISISTGAEGGTSFFINTSTVSGNGGGAGGSGFFTSGGSRVGDGGGNGGNSRYDLPGHTAGGGGAGGYTGNGGQARSQFNNDQSTSGEGGGGGAGGYCRFGTNSFIWFRGGGGGGVGVLGAGGNGFVGFRGETSSPGSDGGGGGGGSSGGSGTDGSAGGNGGVYGGGSGGIMGRFNTPSALAGGNGAVRIIWGSGRSFPSTNTGNV